MGEMFSLVMSLSQLLNTNLPRGLNLKIPQMSHTKQLATIEIENQSDNVSDSEKQRLDTLNAQQHNIVATSCYAQAGRGYTRTAQCG